MSSLSAAAAPFVPGKQWLDSKKKPQQWSGNGPTEFVSGKQWEGNYSSEQTGTQQWSNGDDQEVQYTNDQYTSDGHILTTVRDILNELSVNPGQFNNLMKSMTKKLNTTVKTNQDLSLVADIIFEQSVLEPNFRYTGAKACDYLSTHLNLPPSLCKFRSSINQRVKEAVESRTKMAQDPNTMIRLHGITMFLAELFLTSELQMGGGKPPQRIHVYRVALKEMMEALVHNASSGNLKCLGLLLKLSGKEIEDYDREKTGNKVSEQLNEIFNKARSHTINDAIDRNVRELWLQLIELRAKRWGQSEARAYGNPGGTSAAAAASSMGGAYVQAGGDASSGNVFNNVPVFYNAQGQVISPQEAGFPDEYDDYENYQNYEDPFTEYTPATDPFAEYDMDPSHYQQGPSYEQDTGDDYDQWNAEMQAAYSDFLIESGQEHPA